MGKKILVVEDETAIARVLQAYLTKAGYQVETAFDGDEAIRQFTTIQPDLVLLDLMLPGRDGWSILQEIRRRSSCPVIILTALGQTKEKLAGLNRGADDYITKPFNAEEVVARVNAVLRRPPQIWEHAETRQYGSLRSTLPPGPSLYTEPSSPSSRGIWPSSSFWPAIPTRPSGANS